MKHANAPPTNSPPARAAAASELYPVLSMHPHPLFASGSDGTDESDHHFLLLIVLVFLECGAVRMHRPR
jgi:hypothetical protein